MFKEDGQEYAQVVKMLGNGRLEAYCFDGVTRLCHIRGKLRKKVGFLFTIIPTMNVGRGIRPYTLAKLPVPFIFLANSP